MATHFEAVMFDLDGTLLDTLEDLADSMNEVLRQEGLPTHPVDSYRYFVGDGMENLVRRVVPKERLEEPFVSRLSAAMRTEYGNRWADKTRPYPGIPELLTELGKRGVRTAVLSNKPDDFTRAIVARFFPQSGFEMVMGARKDIPIKPSPQAALDIAKMMGLKPESFLYLGDTNTDMQTAVSAGMHPVGALWGFRSANELLENGAKRLIGTPLELLTFLGQSQ